MTPEGRVKAKVDALLKQAKAYYLKPVQNGMGAPALDYHGVHRGLGVVIETKAPGKHPTSRQVNTLRQNAAAGGACFVIDGVGSDLMELENWLHFPVLGYLSSKSKSCLQTTEHCSPTINEKPCSTTT